MSDFPRYKRDEKRSVKLTSADIEEIRSLRATNVSVKVLAEMFGVTESGIRYQLMTDEQRAEKNKKRADYKKTYNPEVHRRYLDNKKEHDKEGILAYRRKINAASKARTLEATRKRDAEWHRNNRKSRAKVV